MIAKRIAGANAYPGAPKDWDPKRDGECGHLAVRVVQQGDSGYCESAWEPTPKELAMLNAGGQVVLRVVGWQVPVALYVEPAPADQPVRNLVEVPEGWVLVPKEPTYEMVSAAGYDPEERYSLLGISDSAVKWALQRAIAAAPQPPVKR